MEILERIRRDRRIDGFGINGEHTGLGTVAIVFLRKQR